MYDDVMSTADMPERQPEVFKIISEIKNELFKTRDRLMPVIQSKEQLSKSTSPSGSTPLMQELSEVLDIVRSLKQDIYL